jgi:serine phosphatase RsbU (regulator of sigma subunit)
MRFFCLAIFGFLFPGLSALPLPDAVAGLIRNKEPKVQVKLLDSLANQVRNREPRHSIRISQQGLDLAKTNRLEVLTIRTYLTLSRTFRSLGAFDTAVIYMDSAKAFAFEHKVTRQYANVYDQEGLLWMRKSDYEKAARCFYQCIAYAEQEKDSLKLHDAFGHLGNSAFYRHDFRSSLRHYKKSLEYLSSTSNPRSYFLTLDNIGLSYSNLKMMDSALFYQKKSLVEIEKLQDSASLGESCLNVGSTLLAMKRLSEAEPYFKRSYAIHQRIGSEYGIMLASLYLGRLYHDSGKPETALPLLEKSYAIARKLKIPSQNKEVLSSLCEVYNALGDYKKAAEHFRYLVNAMEDVYLDENTKAINELSTKYETEKKQQQIRLLSADQELKQQRIEKDRYIQLFIASIALLLLVLSLVFIIRFRKKKRDNSLLLEKNAAIALQKSEIEAHKELLLYKNREITDSINYARRIQGSVLPSQSLIKTVFPESFVYFMPKDIVSGDFYWLSRSHGYVYLAVADCTGHGVPGAMMSMLGTALLNQVVSGPAAKLPSEILKELHYHILRTLNENMEQRESKDGMDIALIRIDTTHKELLFAGSGRSLYLVRKDELQTIKADKLAIGSTIYDDAQIDYRLHHIDISSPVQLYLFSDGVADQFGGDSGKKLMTRNLLNLLVKLSAYPIAQQEKEFTEAFESWKRGYEQTDDITLLSIKLS